MKYLILGGYTVVANKNKISVACGAISLFVVASFSLFFSLTHYFNFFKMNDEVHFSWAVSLFLSGSPLLFYLSVVSGGYIIGYEKIYNDRVGKILAYIAVLGMVFSLFFSFYVDSSLKEAGYLKCERKSFIAPNKYVIDLKLCR